MKCLNCGTKYEGNYCPECGQSAGTKRFQAIEMFTSVVTSIIGGDNKLLTTCYDLLRRPGYMVREYLLGKRVTYYAPVPLLICLVAIYALASYIITDAVSPFDLIKFNLEEDDVTTGSARTFIQYYAAIIDNKVYFALISVVLNLLPYRYVFRKCKIERPDGTMQQLNLPEHHRHCYRNNSIVPAPDAHLWHPIRLRLRHHITNGSGKVTRLYQIRLVTTFCKA